MQTLQPKWKSLHIGVRQLMPVVEKDVGPETRTPGSKGDQTSHRSTSGNVVATTAILKIDPAMTCPGEWSSTSTRAQPTKATRGTRITGAGPNTSTRMTTATRRQRRLPRELSANVPDKKVFP